MDSVSKPLFEKEGLPVLVARLDIPEEFAWFNELDAEERGDFFMGLLAIITSNGGNLATRIEEYLRGWQATVEIASTPGLAEAIKQAEKSPRHGPYTSFEEAFGRVQAQF